MAIIGFSAFGACGTSSGLMQSCAGLFPTHRQCSVEISNECSNYNLCNPRWYSFSGNCASPLPPIISSSKSGSALFIKTPHTARGAVGVFTYDLRLKGSKKCKEKLAAMFSVPYDFTWYKNQCAVGIFDESTQCDKHLFSHMYYETGKSFIRSKANGSTLTYETDQLTVSLTMSDAYHPVIKVNISTAE